MKNKYTMHIVILMIFVFLSLVFFPTFVHAQSGGGINYTPLEKIPGSSSSGNYVAYIQSIYKFGIWGVGISALFMIMLGGIMYIGSAGNNATAGKAKGIITDAIIGLIMALSAWLILNEINPDLLKINMPKDTSMSGGASSGTGNNNGTNNANGTNNNNPVQDKNCSQMNDAINNNSSGVDPKILKAIMAGGEGCSSKLSSDGKGSCGYSQALPKIRTWCGISGSAAESCAAIQNDPQLDANCAAKLIADNAGRCGMDIQNVASCYNSGKPNNCAKTTNNYCGRVSNYYNNL